VVNADQAWHAHKTVARVELAGARWCSHTEW
jgi:hypothetical protein